MIPHSRHYRRAFARPLRIASCMAPNAEAMCRELARYIGRSLELNVEWVDGIAWYERERLFDRGEIDLCWICGLPYVDKIDAGEPVELCVAPVANGARYGGRPVYFSDVFVRADSRFNSLDDLRGETWAFNEPRSHSGYNVVRYHLAGVRRTLDYFGSRVEAGSHQAALSMIVNGEVAAGAVDSTVFEAEARCNPTLTRTLRVIETMGPSPAPPWVFSTALPHALRAEIRDVLASVHRTAEGAALLASWGIRELRKVSDADYDSIRHMARVGRAAESRRLAVRVA
jgi:phosphonate transport system substrate-binding protein